MNRTKILGLALVAALALTAACASTASAQFTSNKEHTILSGSQREGTADIFTAGLGFGGISCEKVTFSGTSVNKLETTQVILPTFESCKDSFGRTIDVDNGEVNEKAEIINKVAYTFTTGAAKGTVHLSGKIALTVTNSGKLLCIVAIKMPQTNTGVTYTNLSGTKGVEITTHAENIISSTSGGFFNCGVSNGEHKEGTYEGTAIITGKDTAEAATEINVD